MIVYGSSLSPYVRKVLVICAEKGIEVDNQVFGPGVAPTPEFTEASPFGKIPALRDGDYTLADSTAIALYLDAKHPEPRLIPEDAEGRGRAMWFDELADTIVFSTGVKIFFNRVVAPLIGQGGDLAAADAAEADELPQQLAYLENVAPASGWLVGEGFTLADIAIGSMFVNYRLTGGKIDATHHPRFAAYLDRVHARPSFAGLIAQNHSFIDRVRDRIHVRA